MTIIFHTCSLQEETATIPHFGACTVGKGHISGCPDTYESLVAIETSVDSRCQKLAYTRHVYNAILTLSGPRAV